MADLESERALETQSKCHTNRITEGKGGEISPQGHTEMSQISTQASSYPLGAVDSTMASVYSITDVKWVMIKSRLLFRIRLTYKK